MKITLQPAVLRWARQRAKKSVTEVARAARVKESRVLAWEENGILTMNQAQQLAKVTYAPFGYLFLSTPAFEADELPPNVHIFRGYDYDG